MLFKINKVMSKGDEMHTLLYEGAPLEVEVFEDVTISLKVNLKDKNPPGVITINYIR